MRPMKQLTKGIWAIDGLKMGRSYLIEDRDQLTLIDTSSPVVDNKIVAAIESIGRRLDELRTIIATHYHFDHTGNAAALRERSRAVLCAHRDDAPYIDGRRPWGTGRPNPMARFENMIAPAPYALTLDRELVEGDVLPVAGGLEVFHAPGHTPGSIALYAKERGVLFCGDMFMNVFGLQLPPANSTHDMAQVKHSIARLSQLDFDHALPGHGAPVLSRASEKLRQWSRKWLS
jgi:glyoxylase-like metal-dependent hydrolase (beta-lactamase superfamily II)